MHGAITVNRGDLTNRKSPSTLLLKAAYSSRDGDEEIKSIGGISGFYTVIYHTTEQNISGRSDFLHVLYIYT